MSNVTTIYLPCIPRPAVFLEALFLVFCFSSCTPSLSTLISSLSLNHHLYADDTTLLLLSPTWLWLKHYLQNALQQISYWMTANLLTLNSSKTEFLLIGLSKQLAKIDNSSLSTTHSAHNLGFIMNTFPFPITYQLSILLLSHSSTSTSLHPSLFWLQNSLYHCHLHRSLPPWVL